MEQFSQLRPITKGWSADHKYQVTDTAGRCYFLRISPAGLARERQQLFEIEQQLYRAGVPMAQPLVIEVAGDSVCLLESWIEGQDMETALPALTNTQQYELGVRSGEIPRQIHALPAPADQEDWAVRFSRKTDRKIKAYHDCGLRFNGDEAILSYLAQQRALLINRPQCFQHGDYHVGNMMLEQGELRIIDFDRCDYGDPWEEFNRIVWSAALSPAFATGQLDGYFGGRPPLAFFRLLAFYIASNTLSSVSWAIPFGKGEVTTMLEQAQLVLAWFKQMENPVPGWYHAF
ncbi:phosphotransferase [Oscillospiraceae bacterium HV4-5-C5C]|nr:phosphotransferase [Oscillospiraceae bacterium HV4-5-C5C]